MTPDPWPKHPLWLRALYAAAMIRADKERERVEDEKKEPRREIYPQE